jgi:hypothetical protein
MSPTLSPNSAFSGLSSAVHDPEGTRTVAQKDRALKTLNAGEKTSARRKGVKQTDS